MEQLKIRLETETSLTPEQIEKALRTISPFDQEQILPLPASEMEVKVRAMAAIPAKTGFSLKAGLRPRVETSSAMPPESIPANTPPPPPAPASLPPPELKAPALSIPPPPPALKAPSSPSLTMPASNTPPPALKAPGSPSLTPPALKAPSPLTAPSLQVPADQLAPIPGLAAMGGGLRKKNLEGAPLQAPASLPPPPSAPSAADADVYATSKVTPQVYAHKLGGQAPTPAPAQSQHERTTVDLPPLPQAEPAEDPYLTAKVPSPQHLKSISGAAARAPEEAQATAFKVDLSATQNSTMHPPSTPEPKPKTVPGAQVQEDGSVRFKGEFVFDKSAASGGNAKKMLPLIGFGVAALVFVAVVAVGIIKLSSPDKPALPNGKKPGPAAGVQPAPAPVAVVEKPKLPPVQALPQNPRTSLCRLNFFHQQQLDAAVRDSIVTNGFRLELWAALDSLPSNECVLASIDGFSLGINKSGTVYASYPPAGIISASKPLAVRTEPGFPHTYYHLCIEADGKELRLYINGKLQDNSSFKTKTLPNEGMFSIGSPNPELAVLVDEILLTLSPKTTQSFVPSYPLVAAASEDNLAAYMPLERSMPEIYFRTGKAPVTITAESWLDAADRLDKLQEILGEQKKSPPAAKVAGGRR